MKLGSWSLLLGGALVVRSGAFVATPQPATRPLPSSLGPQKTPFGVLVSGPSTSLAGKQLQPAQHHQRTTTALSDAVQSAAISFFDSVRTPSTLIGGSAITALFAISNLVKDPRQLTRTEVFLLRLYHIVSLISLCLSIVTIITATSASTMLLVGNRFDISKAKNVFDFMNTQMSYEFLITRWSFFSSLLLFLVGITNRALLEFQLLKEKRRVAGIFLICSMGSLVSFLLSYINRTLMGPQANFFVLTVDALKVRLLVPDLKR